MRKKKQTRVQTRKEADRIFSIYIRLRDRNEMGLTTCYTCPKTMDFKKAQNGHFVPRQYLSIRYDEVNCHAQCYACNMLYNGQPSAYAKRLETEYGKGTIDMLEEKRKEICPNFNYEEIIQIYTEKLNQMGMFYLL